jgi:ribosome-binding factor A
VKAFKKAAGFIRGELAGRLSLRFTPELIFKADPSIQIGARINQLLAGLTQEQTGGERDEIAPPGGPEDEGT